MADRGMAAAIADGWISDETPEVLHSGLLGWVQTWRDGGQPVVALWLPIIDKLRQCLCYSAEVEACRMAMAQAGHGPGLRLRLAAALRRIGGDDEARTLLDSVTAPPASRIEALIQLLALDRAPTARRAQGLAALEEALLADPALGRPHRELVKALAEGGEVERARLFLRQWTERWPVAPSQLMELGVMAMLADSPHQARALFTPLWADGSETQARAVGRYDGHIPPYGAEIEADLVAKIEAALARPDADAAVALPDFGPIPPGTTVLFVSFAHRALPNDIADHLAAAADQAKISLHLHLDSAIALTADFPGPDEVVAERVDAFAARLEELQPAVVMLDCCSPLGLRGLNPALMSELKRRLGFRLVCFWRDSHRYVETLMRAWAPAADTMAVVDPLSAIFELGCERIAEKAVVLPIPALHPTFVDAARPFAGRDPRLVFAGSVNFVVRAALLSVPMTEDIAFHAIIGHHRADETPDTAAYAGLLGRSRAILNISVHSDRDHLVTGRVWETIAAGALLVEQDNPATARFFTPWRHYLPWRDVADIVQIARFIVRRPDLAERVAAEARAFALERYPMERFWSALLGHALRPRPAAELELDRVGAQAWLSHGIGG